MTTVLVTGANGFIGGHVCQALAGRNGLTPRAMVQPGTDPGVVAELGLPVVGADLADDAALARAVKGADVVLHLAAIASDTLPRERLIAVNSRGTERVLRQAVEAGVRRFVLVSSLAVHPLGGHLDADETAPRSNRWPAYAESKVLAELAVARAERRGAIEAVIARPGYVVYGPRDRVTSLGLVRALQTRRLVLPAGGRARISYSYAENLAQGLVACALTSGISGDSFVLGDGPPLSYRDFLAHWARALGVPAPGSVPVWLAKMIGGLGELAGRLPGWPGGPPLTRYRVVVASNDLHFSSAHARARLRLRPAVPLEQAVQRTVSWACAQPG